MAYADDVAVIGRSVGVLNEVLMQLQTAAVSTGLVINTAKTGYVSKEIIGESNIDIELNGQMFERVDNFKYLGTLFTSQNETEIDIKYKIATGNSCFRAFNKMLGTRYLSKNMKIRTYKTIIRPIILYSSKIWTVTGKMASTLTTWERKILRKIYGSKCEQGVWRIRSNLYKQNIYKSPDVVTDIKVRRLEWLGHVVRMEDTRLPKMVFNAKPEDKRGVGRPRLRWLDGVKAGIKSLSLEIWGIKTQDRKEWSGG
jgi:hypothetical protein